MSTCWQTTRDGTNHPAGAKYLFISSICGRSEKVKAIHRGVPGKLRKSKQMRDLYTGYTYPAMIASLVCQAHECTSLICRIFQRIQGPTTTVQNSCTKMDGILHSGQFKSERIGDVLTIRTLGDNSCMRGPLRKSHTGGGSVVIRRTV